MTNVSVEQALRSQVKLEIGDDDNVTFKQKNMLGQKYGAPAIIVDEDKFWLELEAYHDGI